MSNTKSSKVTTGSNKNLPLCLKYKPLPQPFEYFHTLPRQDMLQRSTEDARLARQEETLRIMGSYLHQH